MNNKGSNPFVKPKSLSRLYIIPAVAVEPTAAAIGEIETTRHSMKIAITANWESQNAEHIQTVINVLPRQTQILTVTLKDRQCPVEDAARNANTIPVKKVPLPGGQHAADYYKQLLRARNEELAHLADCVIVFWNGIDIGCKELLSIATSRGKAVFIVPDNMQQSDLLDMAAFIKVFVESASPAVGAMA